MMDDIVIVPMEMSDSDFEIILEISKRLKLSRNETIRVLIRRGFETLTMGSLNTEGTQPEKSQSPGDKKKRGDKK